MVDGGTWKVTKELFDRAVEVQRNFSNIQKQIEVTDGIIYDIVHENYPPEKMAKRIDDLVEAILHDNERADSQVSYMLNSLQSYLTQELIRYEMEFDKL